MFGSYLSFVQLKFQSVGLMVSGMVQTHEFFWVIRHWKSEWIFRAIGWLSSVAR